MAPQPVEAVFVVFYGLSAHKAVYGRAPAAGRPTGQEGGYTKDYIQCVQDAAFRDLLERLFPVATPGAKSAPIKFKWTQGQSDGSVEFRSADRPHLAWLKTVTSPQPWKMIPTPSTVTAETIPGDPTVIGDPDAATQQFDALAARGVQPYLLAVKLVDDPETLHVRVYIENPTLDLDYAAVDLLPAPILDLVHKATQNAAFKWAAFDSRGGGLIPPEVVDAIERLEENPSLLLIGPPGTGKTVLLDHLIDYIENPSSGIFFDPDVAHDAWSQVDGPEPGKAVSLVLHPSFQYDNMVVGLLPTPTANGIAVKATSGPLVNLAHYASEPGRRALLVLDEFNRANPAAVLGDALGLLDKDKRGRVHIELPYGEIGIEVPPGYEAHGTRKVEPRFTLPLGLWLVAAMNTSDRSVAPLDAAVRRRFTIVDMQPDYDLLAEHLDAVERSELAQPLHDWTAGHVGALAVEVLRRINERIDAVLGIDFRLGHSNFWRVGGETVTAGLQSLAAAFDHRLVQTLRLSMQDDDSALAAVLRAGTSDSPLGGSNSVAYWKKPDPELGSFAQSRIHLRELSSMDTNTAMEELKFQAKL